MEGRWVGQPSASQRVRVVAGTHTEWAFLLGNGDVLLGGEGRALELTTPPVQRPRYLLQTVDGVCVGGDGFACRAGGVWTALPVVLKPSEAATVLARAADGTPWVGTSAGRICPLRGMGCAEIGNPITALMAWHGGWVAGTAEGLVRVTDRVERVPELGGWSITALAATVAGDRVWLGVRDVGVAEWSPDERTVTVVGAGFPTAHWDGRAVDAGSGQPVPAATIDSLALAGNGRIFVRQGGVLFELGDGR